MLDKQKMMSELAAHMPALFKETAYERDTALKLFEWLCAHPHELEKIKMIPLVPHWEGAFNQIVLVEPHEHPYAVVAVDGSQIYPDRHQGISCYLLNSGVAHFTYGSQSTARLFSAPQLVSQADSTEMSEEMVNCKRSEMEFERGLQETLNARSVHPEVPTIFLCDGSLVFWHLESKHPRIKELFLKRYIEQLDAFYHHKVLIAGCISMPKSKELVTVLKNCAVYAKVTAELDTVVDAHIATFFIKPGERTTLFVHNSHLAEAYPTHLKPCFVYMHVGDEIMRIEVPLWIGQNEIYLSRVCRIVYDQCIKGNGYPIALAEAHEQAVVSSQDRQFFYEMLYKTAINQNYRLFSSQKSLKKRIISI